MKSKPKKSIAKSARSRPYTLKKRADQVAETRRRITEAAVELHSTIGPAATTISMIAERAGVQRHTLYAHFPDERSLFMACSGMAMARDPFPDAARWRDVEDAGDRLRAGLREIYDWYARNAEMAGCVLRDAEHHALTREVNDLRLGPPLAAVHAVLGEGLNEPQRAMLNLALSFYTWRTLTRESGLSRNAAVAAMARAVETTRSASGPS